MVPNLYSRVHLQRNFMQKGISLLEFRCSCTSLATLRMDALLLAEPNSQGIPFAVSSKAIGAKNDSQ